MYTITALMAGVFGVGTGAGAMWLWLQPGRKLDMLAAISGGSCCMLGVSTEGTRPPGERLTITVVIFALLGCWVLFTVRAQAARRRGRSRRVSQAGTPDQ